MLVEGVILSAASTTYEYSHIGKAFKDFEILRVIYFVKLVLVLVEMALYVSPSTCSCNQRRTELTSIVDLFSSSVQFWGSGIWRHHAPNGVISLFPVCVPRIQG